MWRLIEDEGSVDQNIVTQNVFDSVQKRVVSDEAMGPVEKQMKTVETLQRILTAAINERLERSTEKRYFVGRKHRDWEHNSIALVTLELLLREFNRHVPSLRIVEQLV